MLLSTQALEAYIEACYDYGDRSCDAEWCLGVNALYWKPHGTDDFLSRTIPVYDTEHMFAQGNKNDKLFETSNPDYTLGFDLFLLKEIPECYACLRLNWTHLGVDESYGCVKSYEGHELEAEKSQLINAFFAENPAKRDLQIDYDRLNLRASKSFYVCENANIAGFLGASYMRLDQRRQNCVECPESSMSSVIIYKESSELSAGLGEIGLTGKVDLCPSTLYILGESGIITGVGTRNLHLKGHSHQTPPITKNLKGSYSSHLFSENGIPIENSNSDSICFTGLEYKFEMGLTGYFCGFDWEIQAGYEGIFFHDLGTHFLPGSPTHFSSTTSNLGFAGPYIGFAICM